MAEQRQMRLSCGSSARIPTALCDRFQSRFLWVSHPQGLALTEGVPGYAKLKGAAGNHLPALRSVIRRR